MKVIHLPYSIGGNAWALAQAEGHLGVQSHVLNIVSDVQGRPCDINLNLDQSRGAVRKFFKLSQAFLKIRNRYDVFHFNFGSSLFHFFRRGWLNMELPLYPRNAKLFVTYQGCDVRQKYPTMNRGEISACHNPNCYGGQCNSGRLDELRRKSVEKMARHAKHVWALNPDLLYFLPPEKSSFLPYAVDMGTLGPLKKNDFKKSIRIAHAPTDRGAKGTHIIIHALSRLQAQYPGRVEFDLIENVSWKNAQLRYLQADLVIDQILIGWYGVVAVEVMKMGIPVIARINHNDLKFVPKEMASQLKETIINTDPASLYTLLSELVENSQRLIGYREASLDFAHRWHDSERVAKLTIDQYQNS